jgi:hypothetical protein
MVTDKALMARRERTNMKIVNRQEFEPLPREGGKAFVAFGFSLNIAR